MFSLEGFNQKRKRLRGPLRTFRSPALLPSNQAGLCNFLSLSLSREQAHYEELDAAFHLFADEAGESGRSTGPKPVRLPSCPQGAEGEQFARNRASHRLLLPHRP